MTIGKEADAATFAADKKSVAWWGIMGALFPLVAIPIAYLRKPSVPLHLLSAMPNDAAGAVAFEAAYADRLKRRQIKTAWLGFLAIILFYVCVTFMAGFYRGASDSVTGRAEGSDSKEASTSKPAAKRPRPVTPAKPSIRRKPTPPKDAPAAKPQANPEPKPKRRRLTLQSFNQLEIGMSYKEVVRVLGREGKEDSRMELLGSVITTYTWKDGLMSSVVLTFEDDGLSNRMQFGLPEK